MVTENVDALLREHPRSRATTILLAGALGLAIIFAVMVLTVVPEMEHDLTTRATDTLTNAGISGALVSTEGRTLILRGSVPHEDDRDIAVALAQSVGGISGVVDEIKIGEQTRTATLSPTVVAPQEQQSSAGWNGLLGRARALATNWSNTPGPLFAESRDVKKQTVANDESIANPTATESVTVSGEPEEVRSRIIYEFEPEGVQLIGVLPNEAAVVEVIEAAKALFGKDKVTSQLTVNAAATRPTWLTQANIVAGQLTKMHSGTLVVDGEEVALGGEAARQEDIDAIMVAARSLFGDERDIKNLMIVSQNAEAVAQPAAMQAPKAKAPAASKPIDTRQAKLKQPSATAASVDLEIANVLERAECTALRASVDANGTVTINGLARAGDTLKRVGKALVRIKGVRGLKEGQISLVPNDMCQVLDAFGHLYAASSMRTSIIPANSTGEFANGEALMLKVNTELDGAYLYVDYFDLQGNVMHLSPSGALPSAVNAGTPIVLGADGEWVVSKPFGREVALALATPEPLFDQVRPEAEHGKSYLDTLVRRLGAIADKHGEESISVALMVITTKP